MALIAKARTAALAVGGALLLGGCGYGSYGSVGLGVGYGAPGYYDPYFDNYAGGWGYGPWGYGYPSYGWYNGFYYPGSGIYVFDRGGRRHRWNDDQQRHWAGRGQDRGVWTRQQRPGGWNGRPPQGQPGQQLGSAGQGRGRPGGWSGQPQPGAAAPAFRGAPGGGFTAPAPRPSMGGGGGHGVWTRQR